MVTEMQLVTKSDFDKYPWQKVFENLPGEALKNCSRVSSEYKQLEEECQKSGDSTGEKVYRILAEVMVMHFDADSVEKPIVPFLENRVKGMRSMSVDDFSEAQLDEFKALLTDTKNAEARARLADIVWLGKRDFQAAGIAADAYLEAAKEREHPDTWMYCVDRLKRAVVLVKKINDADRFQRIVEYIEEALERYGGKDSRFLSARMMQILIRYRKGDPNKYAALSETAARHREENENWELASLYWEIKVKWHRLEKNQDAANEAERNAAETLIKEAHWLLQKPTPSYLVIANHIQRGIYRLKPIAGTRERVEELHKELLEYQKLALKEFKPIEHSVDVSELAKQSQQRVKGKKVYDAIFALAFICNFSSAARVRKDIEENIQKFPLSSLFGSQYSNRAGKVIARVPPTQTNDAEVKKIAIKLEMYKKAAFLQKFDVVAIIEPAREQIVLEHRIKMEHILFVVSDNPLVSERRINTVAEGLLAGFNGDFFMASHIIIPQIEESMRYVLGQCGEIVSIMKDKDEVEQEMDLNRILTDGTLTKMLSDIFGEDTLFAMRSLLIEELGCNLRNRIAHGLMDDDEFFGESVEYVWWLMLRLCCEVKYKQIEDRRQQSSQSVI